MAISKKLREVIRQKYNGLCAYTGKPLGDDWQVDHMTSKIMHTYNVSYSSNSVEQYLEKLKEVNDTDNLVPTCRIINHYKRSYGLEGFRHFMKNFHNRLAKLPKKTIIERTKNRIRYMNEVAELFDITPKKPFDGVFYFEKMK